MLSVVITSGQAGLFPVFCNNRFRRFTFPVGMFYLRLATGCEDDDFQLPAVSYVKTAEKRIMPKVEGVSTVGSAKLWFK